MAYEWVGPVAVGVVGLAGMYATFITGDRTRKHAEVMAHSERQQQRKAEAYVEVLIIAERIGGWAQSVRPMIDQGAPLPPIPSFEDQTRAEALLKAFASETARERFETWRKAVWDIILADRAIGFGLEARGSDAESGGDAMTVWRRLEQEFRPHESSLRTDLGKQLSRELAGVS